LVRDYRTAGAQRLRLVTRKYKLVPDNVSHVGAEN
jgi:hypothetical protein